MEKLADFQCVRVLQQIVERFGEGVLPKEGYVFDEIKKLPSGYVGEKINSREVVSQCSESTDLFSVIFDPNPQSRFVSEAWLRDLDMSPVSGLKISGNELSLIFAAQDCDFYLCDGEDNLIAVATHEDEFKENERCIWRVRKI